MNILAALEGVDLASLEYTHPAVKYLSQKVEQVTGQRPCLWQIRVAIQVCRGEKDVVCISGTGSGKTLTFWLPLFIREQGVQIVVTPLNALGDQNVEQLARMGIKAVAISAETATEETLKKILDPREKIRAIIINPEMLVKPGGIFGQLLKVPGFPETIISVIIDEAHCVSKWGGFRPQYKEIGRLRYLLPDNVCLHITSATLPPAVLKDVSSILELDRDPYYEFRDNDRPKVHVLIRKIMFPYHTYWDLTFLVPVGWKPGNTKPPLFLVVFDSISNLHGALAVLRQRLSAEFRNWVVPFHSEMSEKHKKEVIARMKEGKVLGVLASEGFGLGIDVPRIELVVQWRTNVVDFCTLWQRLGRAARDPSMEATAIVFADKGHFDDERAAREQRSRKRKAHGAEGRGSTKRARTSEGGDRVDTRNAGVVTTDEVQGDEEMAAAIDSGPGATQPAWATPEFLRERQRIYQTRSGAENKKGDKDEATIDPALDDMINARWRGFCCTRRPAKLYFAHGRRAIRDDAAFCRPQLCASDPPFCLRCRIPSPRLCCELCSPAAFETVGVVQARQFSSLPRRSTMPKTYAPPARLCDDLLWKELDEWRNTRMKELNYARWAMSGPAFFMPNGVLDEIVRRVHVGFIGNVSDLKKETHWRWADAHGPDVLAIIDKHRQTLPSQSALASSSASTPAAPPQPSQSSTDSITSSSVSDPTQAFRPSRFVNTVAPSTAPATAPVSTSSVIPLQFYGAGFQFTAPTSPSHYQTLYSSRAAMLSTRTTPPRTREQASSSRARTARRNRGGEGSREGERSRSTQRCGTCRQQGHNKRSCPSKEQIPAI